MPNPHEALYQDVEHCQAEVIDQLGPTAEALAWHNLHYNINGAGDLSYLTSSPEITALHGNYLQLSSIFALMKEGNGPEVGYFNSAIQAYAYYLEHI